MKTYWISFADKKNLGCCIVDATDVKAAIAKTVELGINPGGEAQLIEYPVGNPEAEQEILRWGKNRLIPYEALIQRGAIDMNNVNPAIYQKMREDPRLSIVCQKCNEGECNEGECKC